MRKDITNEHGGSYDKGYTNRRKAVDWDIMCL